jgi:hypothetical protein
MALSLTPVAEHDLLQGIAAGPAAGRQKRALGTHRLIQVVEDRGAVDEAFAVVEHQGGTRTSGLKARISSALLNTERSWRSNGMPSTVSETPTRRTKGES